MPVSIGAAAGSSSAFVAGFGNHIMQGQNAQSSLLAGAKAGVIGGASGFVLGGFLGGIDAKLRGRRFWDGASVREEPLALQDIPIVEQIGDNNCLTASAEAVDRSFCGSMTQQDVRNLQTLGGDPNTTPLGDVDVWSAYGAKSGHSVSGELRLTRASTKLSNVLSNMQNGNRVAITFQTGDVGAVGHSVVMQSVVQKTITKINGRIVQKYLYYVMDPANGGGILRIGSGTITNANNIFYISY